MSNPFRLVGVTVVLFLSPICFAALQLPPSASTNQTSSEVPALRGLVAAFYDTWPAKDMEGFSRLWSKQSPHRETRKQALQKFLAVSEKIEVKAPLILKTNLDGEKAKLRVDVEVNAVEAKTGKPAAGNGLRKRVLECVKEKDGWLIWREESAFEDLAVTLISVSTEQERETLLTNENDLWSGELGLALNAQGMQLASRSLYPKAIDIFHIARGVAERIGDRTGLAVSRNNLGLAHYYLGEHELALEHLSISLQLSEGSADKINITRALNNMGLVYQNQAQIDLAIKSYRRSLEIAQLMGETTLIAMASGNLGNLYNTQGKHVTAAGYFQTSLTKYQEAGNKAGEARILNSLGNIHTTQGNLELALQFFRESLALKEKVGTPQEQARTLDAMATVYLIQANYQLAEEFERKSLALYEASNAKVGIADALKGLGGILYRRGDQQEALKYIRQSLEMSEAIGAQEFTADALNHLAEIYLSDGKPTQALESAERAAEIAQQIGSLYLYMTACAQTGKAYRVLNRPVQARQAFEKSISATESMREQTMGGARETQGFFANKDFPYHELIWLLLDGKQSGEALAYAERSKARSLLDVLQSGKSDMSASLSEDEQEQERKLKGKLFSLNTQLARGTQIGKPNEQAISEIKAQLVKARLDYEAFQASLYLAHPKLKINRGETLIIKPEELAALVPDTASTLIEYVLTDNQTFLFAITKVPGQAAIDVQTYIMPVNRTKLEQLIETFRQQLAARDLGFRATATKLYDLLLKPAQAQLKGKTKLVIVPDGKLWELPFQALPTGANRYLIEDAAISYAPSLTVLREMMKRNTKSSSAPTLLALGNPALGKETIERATFALRDGKFDPLPEAESEVKALGQLYGTARSKVYVNAAAREDRVKVEAAQARVLHFATHGVLNDAAPMYSHLVLAQGEHKEVKEANTEDGLLEAWELMQMDLQADLAVLSACETARGKFGGGEGVIGLSWALFVAGVPSTVVSQWKVESAATRELMIAFHRRLLTAQTTKAAALRQAALSLLKRPATSHPFYWAGFVLVGDGR